VRGEECMTTKTSLHWKYHIINLLILILGIALIGSGVNTFNSAVIIHIGIWFILASIILFFGRNIAYMLEGELKPHHVV